MDYIRDTLPREIIDLILFFMPLSPKRILRSTNRYWFGYIKLDQFKIYFARPKTLPDIVQHFQQLYGDRPIGISLQNIATGRAWQKFPVQDLLPLTNLTSFSFKPIQGTLGRIKQVQTLTALTNLCKLSKMPINDGQLTNLTSITFDNADNRALLKLYTNLRKLYVGLYKLNCNPFELVANPSRLTKIDISLAQMKIATDRANLLTQFYNLKTMKYYQIAEGPLPPIFQYLTGLKRLELWRGIPQDDIFQLTRLTYLAAYTDHFKIDRISTFNNLKQLVIPHDADDEKYSCLQSLTALEELNFHHSTVTPSPTKNALRFVNSQKLTRLDINSASEFFNMDHLSIINSLQLLVISESMHNKVQKSYDSLAALTNLTSLFINTQIPSSDRFTILNSISSLKQLSFNVISYDQQMDMHPDVTFSNLTNLESLHCSLGASQAMYEELSRLSHLTNLNFKISTELFDQNINVFHQMTQLRDLTFSEQILSHRLWDLVTCLTNLECLDVWRVNSEEIIESFSVLTNLTNLSVRRSHKIKGNHLTKLTNLQMLYFISKPARKLWEKKDMLTEKLPRLYFVEFRF